MAEQVKLIANNKKAYHDYFIDDTYEAGVALHGTEVKSLRMGKCSIKEAYVKIENGEVCVYNMHISPYEKGIRSVLRSSFYIRVRSGNLPELLLKKALRSYR